MLNFSISINTSKFADELKQITSAVKTHSSHQHNGHKIFIGETFKGQKPQKALVAHKYLKICRLT